jgi:hypothetical protein
MPMEDVVEYQSEEMSKFQAEENVKYPAGLMRDSTNDDVPMEVLQEC